MRRVGLLLLAAGCLAGCSSTRGCSSLTRCSSRRRPSTIAEEELLDVGIGVFDPGVPEGEVDKEVLEELIREGTFVQIRRTEALYMAVLLRDTLQKSGQLGVGLDHTGGDSTAADLTVGAARFCMSDGDQLRLHVTAKDATGRVWLDKDYEM